MEEEVEEGVVPLMNRDAGASLYKCELVKE